MTQAQRSIAVRIAYQTKGAATLPHIMALVQQGWTEQQIVKSIAVPAVQ